MPFNGKTSDKRPLTLAAVRWAPGQAFVPWTSESSYEQSSPLSHAKWIILGPSDAIAHPKLPEIVHDATTHKPNTDIFYGDTAILHARAMPELQLKGSLDRTQLMVRDYIGPLLVIKADTFYSLGGLHYEVGSAVLYDLVWRALDASLSIGRIEQILVAVSAAHAEAILADRLAVMEARFKSQHAPFCAFPSPIPNILQIERIFPSFPEVTIIVPTKLAVYQGKITYLQKLLQSLDKTDWPMDKLKVIVGDDNLNEDILYSYPRRYHLERIPTVRENAKPFNYSAKMNMLWRRAETNYLVLMNDDIEVISPKWLKALMTFAMEPDVGVVGARLLFPSGRIQHAGVVGGLLGLCAHPWFNQTVKQPTYENWGSIQREWSAVTGAVMATRRSVLEKVSGFDEIFFLDFNDIDLCFRLLSNKLRVVYNPAAEFIHHEKSSRGQHKVCAEEQYIFLRRWQRLLENDPYINRGIELSGVDMRPAPTMYPSWLKELRAKN